MDTTKQDSFWRKVSFAATIYAGAYVIVFSALTAAFVAALCVLAFAFWTTAPFSAFGLFALRTIAAITFVGVLWDGFSKEGRDDLKKSTNL